jgi:hypothetical protein
MVLVLMIKTSRTTAPKPQNMMSRKDREKLDMTRLEDLPIW